MGKITYFDFCGFVLLGIFVFICIVCGLTILREFISSEYFVKSSCLLEDIRDVGLRQCNACDKRSVDQHGLDEEESPGCLQSSFPCFQIHVRYYNGHIGESVIGILHSSLSQLTQVPQCSHNHCSRNLTENKRTVNNFVDNYKRYRDGDSFECHYDPNNPRRVLAAKDLKWEPVFHCMFWPGLGALLTMSCLCCRLYLWERLPCRKTKTSKRENTKRNLYGAPVEINHNHTTVKKDISSQHPHQLPDMSPAPSFKSIDMSGNSPLSGRSVASIYWSYPSLASHSHGPSLATSTASFRTALEQFDDISRDETMSFHSVATSKRDLNSPVHLDCDTNTTFVPSNDQTVCDKTDFARTKEISKKQAEDVWVKRQDIEKKTEKLLAQSKPSMPTQKQNKTNGTPLGIKRFQNGTKPAAARNKKETKSGKSALEDKSLTDTLNRSF